MANINTTALATELKTQYEKRLLSRAVPRMIHAKWAMPARVTKSNTLEFRKFGSLPMVTNPLTEGSTPSETAAPSISVVTATPIL